MRTMRWVLGFCALSALLTLAGCGGGGGKTEVTNTTQTEGQRLMDLQKAYDSGVISKSDYDKQREKILDAK